ncbi:hypothetical protein IGI04_030200 [Brassica rapa subsp. trilocularis]|uniref:Uncharacterized protein n=1 Tax=Brassica rapa subsp. trilocularis TaxID=1813537 RepID=A0ABQ7LQ48_BRACM|nr:hypothetical protein IGI04_030200 [Brassica rapa subsp. trilocularis]
MGDQDKDKNMENPYVVQKGCDRTQIEHQLVRIMDTAQGVIFQPTQQVKTDGRARIHFGRGGRSVTYLDELSELSDTSLELNELSDTEDGAGLVAERNGHFSAHREIHNKFNLGFFRMRPKAWADHNQTANLDAGRLGGWFESHHRLGGWSQRLGMSQKARVAKGCELPKSVSDQKVISNPYGSVYDLLSQYKYTVYISQGPRPDQDMVDKFILSVIIWIEELRMVLVKPRSREGSVSESLCIVWLDDAREELVIVYETVKKL